MRFALVVLVLVGLTSFSECNPVPNVHAKIRNALHNIRQLRSAIRTSIDKREAEERSHADSVVRELEPLQKVFARGLIGNVVNSVAKSAAKRHLDTKRSSVMATRDIGRTIAKQAKRLLTEREQHKQVTRDLMSKLTGGLFQVHKKRDMLPDLIHHPEMKRLLNEKEHQQVARDMVSKLSGSLLQLHKKSVRNLLPNLNQHPEMKRVLNEKEQHKQVARDMMSKLTGSLLQLHKKKSVRNLLPNLNLHPAMKRDNNRQVVRAVAGKMKKAVDAIKRDQMKRSGLAGFHSIRDKLVRSITAHVQKARSNPKTDNRWKSGSKRFLPVMGFRDFHF